MHSGRHLGTTCVTPQEYSVGHGVFLLQYVIIDRLAWFSRSAKLWFGFVTTNTSMANMFNVALQRNLPNSLSLKRVSTFLSYNYSRPNLVSKCICHIFIYFAVADSY